MADKESLGERVTAIETRCPLREESTNNQFKEIYRILGKIEYAVAKNTEILNSIDRVVGNGLQSDVKELKERIGEHEKMIVAHTRENKRNVPESNLGYWAFIAKEIIIKAGIPILILLAIGIMIKISILDKDALDTLINIFTHG